MSGRKKGQKNLKRVGNKVINSSGVSFTEREQKQLQSLVNSVNRKRKKIMTDERYRDMRTALGVDPDFILGVHSEKNLWGTGADPLLSVNRSKSLNRFKTKEDYRKYIKSLKNMARDDYVESRLKHYKRNKIKAIKEVYGDSAKEQIRLLNKLTIEEFAEVLRKGRISDTYYLNSDYDESDGELDRLKAQVNKIADDFQLHSRKRKYNKKKV